MILSTFYKQNNYNDEISKMYYDSQVDAISLIVKTIKDNNLFIKHSPYVRSWYYYFTK